jgi:hypothetical protein
VRINTSEVLCNFLHSLAIPSGPDIRSRILSSDFIHLHPDVKPALSSLHIMAPLSSPHISTRSFPNLPSNALFLKSTNFRLLSINNSAAALYERDEILKTSHNSRQVLIHIRDFAHLGGGEIPIASNVAHKLSINVFYIAQFHIGMKCGRIVFINIIQLK